MIMIVLLHIVLLLQLHGYLFQVLSPIISTINSQGDGKVFFKGRILNWTIYPRIKNFAYLGSEKKYIYLFNYIVKRRITKLYKHKNIYVYCIYIQSVDIRHPSQQITFFRSSLPLLKPTIFYC